MTVAKNMKVELFADERCFPELVNPVQMARYEGPTVGRHPGDLPALETHDADERQLVDFEDTNNDGKADKRTTCRRHIHNPTGFGI